MKLNPVDLSLPTPTAILLPGSYSHERQRSDIVSPELSGYQTNTFNGTQTYGANGRPADSDNDSDRNH